MSITVTLGAFSAITGATAGTGKMRTSSFGWEGTGCFSPQPGLSRLRWSVWVFGGCMGGCYYLAREKAGRYRGDKWPRFGGDGVRRSTSSCKDMEYNRYTPDPYHRCIRTVACRFMAFCQMGIPLGTPPESDILRLNGGGGWRVGRGDCIGIGNCSSKDAHWGYDVYTLCPNCTYAQRAMMMSCSTF